MAGKYRAPGFASGEILIPGAKLAPEKWAVIACDQFTSDLEYWTEVENEVGDSPSTLRVTLPEIYLHEAEKRIPDIRSAMNSYMESGALVPGVRDGFVLVDRVTTCGHRLGLLGMIDLEQYDYTPGANCLVRPTEGTIPERVPPRARIRSGAPLELPHVMMLIDDRKGAVIESLYAQKEGLRRLYDFDLMQGGGHITGYAVEGESAESAVQALTVLHDACGGLMYAVGDGNHSLAAAKRCWEEIRANLADGAESEHPARYAMVELVNIHCPALVFEPIHRVVKGAEGKALIAEYERFLAENGVKWRQGEDVRVLCGDTEARYGFDAYPLGDLQNFLSAYVESHAGVEVDYIHGEDELRALVKNGFTGFVLSSINKSELLPYVRDRGVLPRKAFSMGEARDKRYYMEARRLTQ